MDFAMQNVWKCLGKLNANVCGFVVEFLRGINLNNYRNEKD